jgi:hypothetical protein
MGCLRCSNVVLFQSICEGFVVHQDLGMRIHGILYFRTYPLLRTQVVATLTCDTIHQALITHSSTLVVNFDVI